MVVLIRSAWLVLGLIVCVMPGLARITREGS
jgi:hypothetical protein